MRKLVLILLLLSTVVLGQGGIVNKEDFKRAQVLAEAGHWEDALKALAPILKQDPRYSDAVYLQGVCYLGMKDYPAARKSFLLITELEPKFMPGYQMVGSTYLSEKNYPEAKKFYEKMLLLPGGTATAQYCLGVVAYAQRDLGEAQKQWKEALRTDPSMASAHNSLGICYQLTGNNTLALSEFQDAVRVQPENPYYKFSLGVQLLLMRRVAEAKHYLTDVMQQNTRDDLSLAAAAFLAAEANESDKAVKLATMALGKNEDLSMLLVLQGEQWEKLKQTAKAREAYQKALDSDPNLEAARKALARLGTEPSPSPSPSSSPAEAAPPTVPAPVTAPPRSDDTDPKSAPPVPTPSATPPHEP